MGGWWVALNFVFSLGILAVLENFVPEDKNNESDQEDWFPDSILWLHVAMQIVSIATLIYSIQHFEYNFFQFILIGISVGVNSGSSAIVIAHELIHRKNKYMRLAGQFLLLTACNIYFYVDHLKVHHKWVGTGNDPATAKYNESLYAFFIRSTIGQIKSSFNVEGVRLRLIGKNPWSINNYVIGSLFILLIFGMVLSYLFGPAVLIAFLLQGFFANFLLEYTNYIEHYGLTRRDQERVTEVHSWQTDRVISRFFLIDLSRHADHHYYASKPYHTLLSHEGSPVLPGGYVSMIYYALCPPLFFKKVNEIIEKRNRS